MGLAELSFQGNPSDTGTFVRGRPNTNVPAGTAFRPYGPL